MALPQLQSPYLNQNLTQVISLDSGLIAVLVNAATAVGFAASQIFTVGERPAGGDRSLTLTPVQVGGVSALTVDIEVSSDGGTTWQKKHVGVALITASVSTQAVEANIQAGYVYRVNITTLTAGTNVSINGTAN